MIYGSPDELDYKKSKSNFKFNSYNLYIIVCLAY